MGTVTTEYASSSALTISPQGVATSATLVACVESTAVDNSSNKYDDYILAGKWTSGTTPTAGQVVLYVIALAEDSTYPDVMDGTASAETWLSQEVRNGAAEVARAISVDTTSDRTYWFGAVSVKKLFGGVMPKKWVAFVTHNTVAAANSTAGNHALWITPVYYSVA